MRTGGVAIYEKLAISPISTSHAIEKLSEQYDPILLEAENYGDICAADILVDNIKMVLFCVYLSPNTTIKQTKAFMTRNLFSYKSRDIPIIVTGDFNIDISKEENVGFVKFMKDFLKLDLVSDSRQPTTLSGSCIDMIFARNTPDLPTKRFITYFSYHRPLFTLLSAVSFCIMFLNMYNTINHLLYFTATDDAATVRCDRSELNVQNHCILFQNQPQ